MNDSDLLTFVQSLIDISSFDPKKSVLPKFIIEQLKKYKIKYSIIKSNGITNFVLKTSSKTNVLFNAHWDTVAPQINAKNKKTILHSGDFLCGLGVCDMKAGLAAMFAAFIDCSIAGIPGITLSLVGDEETGGKNGTKILVERQVLGKYVILGEPTGLQISLGQKGGVHCMFISKGIAAHGAYPQKGENAITKLMVVINKIIKEFPLPQKDILPEDLFSKVTVSVNTISGGSSKNVVPNSAQASLDIRIPPSVHIEDILKKIRKMAEEECVETEFDILGTGWNLNKNNTLTKVTSQIVQNVVKREPQFIYKMGTNDGKYYADKCEIINIGPGDSKLSHTSNEKVSLDEIIQARNIYRKLAQKLSK